LKRQSCPLCRSLRTGPFSEIGSKTYLRCVRCGLTFLSPGQRLDRPAERARYALHQNRPDDPDYRAFLSRLAGPLLEKLAPGAEGLDFGCGPGPTLSVMLREKGFPMRIYDPFFAPDAGTLERTYDFITCTETVEHFRSPGREFIRLDRMLRPGGWLGVMTGILESDERFSGWHYPLDPTHVCFLKRETAEWIARRFSWEAVYPARDVILFEKSGDRRYRGRITAAAPRKRP
jgi:SAM-dependent methyltransferase